MSFIAQLHRGVRGSTTTRPSTDTVQPRLRRSSLPRSIVHSAWGVHPAVFQPPYWRSFHSEGGKCEHLCWTSPKDLADFLSRRVQKWLGDTQASNSLTCGVCCARYKRTCPFKLCKWHLTTLMHKSCFDNWLTILVPPTQLPKWWIYQYQRQRSGGEMDKRCRWACHN